jgi:hypothetical protein
MPNLSVVYFLLLFCSGPLIAQHITTEAERIEELNLEGPLPEKLLSTRTAGFYHYTLTPKELQEVQLTFQRTGIDAIIHFELDKLFASKDVTKAFIDYLAKREISNLVFIEKSDEDYRITITSFSAQDNILTPRQPAWSTSNRLLTEALKTLHRAAANSQKKQNLLINDMP